MPVIRLARIDDVPLLAAVERDAGSIFRAAGLAWIAEAEPLQAAWLTGQCVQRMLWVATGDNGDLVGFLAADRVDGDFYIAEVSVVPSAQKQGIGAALIETAIRRANADGFKRAILTTYRDLPWNGPFYARLGFAEAAIATVGPELLGKLRDETAAGHDPARRCVMARAISDPVESSA